MIRPFTQAEITAATDAAIADLEARLTAATERAEKAEAELGETNFKLSGYIADCLEYRARVAALEGVLQAAVTKCDPGPNSCKCNAFLDIRMPDHRRDCMWAKCAALLSAQPAPATCNESSQVRTVNDPLTVGAVKESLTTAVSQAAADVLTELRARIAKLETADQYWAADDPEDSFATDPTDVVDFCDPPRGVPVKILRSRSLPAEWGIAIPTKFGADGEIEESDVITFPTEAEAIAAYEDAKERLDRAAEREG